MGKYIDYGTRSNKTRGLGYTRQELRKMLPKVGDRLIRPMTRAGTEDLKLYPCVVVEVNVEHYWYRVRFDATGWCQCFKLPES